MNGGAILVTGGAGRLARALRRTDQERVITARRTSLNICDRAGVDTALEVLRPSVVINAAGFTRVDAAESSPDEAARANIDGANNLALACSARDVPLIHISTDFVFGDGERAWREDDPVCPLNVYGRTKAWGESKVIAAGGIVVRVAWLFGFTNDFLHSMLERGTEADSIYVTDDQIGSPTPIGELAKRLLRLADRLAVRQTVNPSILHLAGAPPTSRADWVERAFDVARGTGLRLAEIHRRPSAAFTTAARRPLVSALDTSLARTLFGDDMDWRPETEALARAWAQRRSLA